MPLSEEKAVELALSGHNLVRADSLDLLRQEMAIREMGSALWPKLDLQLGYSYNSYVSRMEMVSPIRWRFQEMPPGSGQGYAFPDSFRVDTFEFGRTHSFRFSLTLSRTLWSWGRMERGYLLQKRFLETRWRDYNSRKLRYAYTVRRLYILALLSEEVVKVAENSLRFSEENLKLTREAYENGRATKLDLLRAEVENRNARYRLEEAKKDLESALRTLKVFLNLHDSVRLELTDTLSIPPSPPDTTLLREDIEVLKEQVGVLRAMAREELKGFLPGVFGAVSFNYQRPLGFEDRWGSNWVATLSLKWTLFDGLKPYSSYRKLLYRSEALQRRVDFLEAQAKADVRNAYGDYMAALKRVEVAKEALGTAGEAYELAKVAYRNGRITYTDLRQVELSYEQALLNYKRAVADARLYHWKVFYLTRTSL